MIIKRDIAIFIVFFIVIISVVRLGDHLFSKSIVSVLNDKITQRKVVFLMNCVKLTSSFEARKLVYIDSKK